ncbi:MAG: penicillin-binding protein 1C [Acetobacter sp.]|nr:penicillin-binding protein 1C [Acetobacter sp.]
MKHLRIRLGWFLGVLATLLLFCFIFCPKPLLLEHYNFSRAVYDRNGKLLNLSLSLDEKYRLFVPYQKINDNTKKALLAYEDRRFFKHFGVDILSIFRAAGNMALGGRRQGASTLTMQVARLRWRLDTSSLWGKFMQILRAIQLERHYSKEDILEAYYNLCPMGGNIEGIGAAALIYFDVEANALTLPQAAAIAVIPQNPEKRHPLKKDGAEQILQAVKRLKTQWITLYGDNEAAEFDLPIVFERHLPKTAMHTVRRVKKLQTMGDIHTSIDSFWQKRLEETLCNYIAKQQVLGVRNAAAMIVNRQTMEVIAESGSADFFDVSILGQVDGITARRSSGSTLKPFIYALALEQGIIHPLSLLRDVPENYGFYTPENFDHSFKGLINATDALVQSRNIPAVELLLELKDNSFYNLLKNAGVPKLKSAKHYGLSIALGGAEVTMQNLAELYAMLGNLGNFRKLQYFADAQTSSEKMFLTPESAYLTLEMLKTNQAVDKHALPYLVARDKYEVYWKTGTSFGFRDAWSVGIAGDYVFVVWIGNFDNTPNNALTGRSMAAPLMFTLIRMMAADGLIKQPEFHLDELQLAETKICLATGELAGADCDKIAQTYFIPNITQTPYNNISRRIPIDIASGKRACRHTPPTTELKTFQFWDSYVYQIYEQAGIQLNRPPEFLEDCSFINEITNGKAPVIKQPVDGSTLIAHGKNIKLTLKADTDADVTEIFWFINDVFVGKNARFETLVTDIPNGKATIRAVDNLGRTATISIIGKKFLHMN